MKRESMTLEEWMKEKGLKKKWVAEQLGITYEWLWAVTRGRHHPNERLVKKLSELTGGKVQTFDSNAESKKNE